MSLLVKGGRGGGEWEKSGIKFWKLNDENKGGGLNRLVEMLTPSDTHFYRRGNVRLLPHELKLNSCMLDLCKIVSWILQNTRLQCRIDFNVKQGLISRWLSDRWETWRKTAGPVSERRFSQQQINNNTGLHVNAMAPKLLEFWVETRTGH